MTDRESRSSQPERDGTGQLLPAASGAEPETAAVQPARRVRRSGTGYDLSLKHSDPTSLNPAYIVRTGEPVDQEPGRTSRLTWTKGRRRPISEREAYNVFWRRKAARIKRMYSEPDKNQAALSRMPATLEEALAALPRSLPPWSATRAVVSTPMPERLLAFGNAYSDIQECSLPQLMELALYRLVNAPVMKPADFKAEYEAMRQQTYQTDRQQLRQTSANGEDDD